MIIVCAWIAWRIWLWARWWLGALMFFSFLFTARRWAVGWGLLSFNLFLNPFLFLYISFLSFRNILHLPHNNLGQFFLLLLVFLTILISEIRLRVISMLNIATPITELHQIGVVDVLFICGSLCVKLEVLWCGWDQSYLILLCIFFEIS